MWSNQALISKLLIVTATFLSTVVAQFGLGGIPLQPASPPVLTANKTGPYNVGVRQDSYMSQSRNLTRYWWYPAQAVNDSTPFVSAGGIQGESVLNAPVDSSGGPYPLILFSPGLGAYADAYYFYVQNLASHGYVVVSLEHYDTKSALPTSDLPLRALAEVYQSEDQGSDAVEVTYTEWFRSTQFALTYRAQEIKAGLLTALLHISRSSSPFFGAVDITNIGMSGHSLGAFYTLLVGGGMPIFCDYNMTAAELDPDTYNITEISPCAFPARHNLSGPFELENATIKAIIPLAAPMFIQESQLARAASKMHVPMMVLTGDDLQEESTRTPQRTVYENSKGESYWVMVTNTSHYLVGDAYQLNPTFSLSLPAKDRAEFLGKAEVYMTYSAAFFDLYLKGNKSAKLTMKGGISSPYLAEFDYHTSKISKKVPQ
ncbi:alpha/beta-hydrolase [Mollisia scopiformis]|uniref:1-alkyl-2-acetylglycerophosphocholine esterase n=1 Tax=Mollisia scopiformis TaxID=149040 RepID=A0A132B4A8_MOLSC|nr:alpha/beta-hydrolase [Mollisia scopiformis]KUJ06849.1 alpha/beta-hydrolase [Mollisia scopiformis]